MTNPVVIMGGWLTAPNDYRGMAQVLAGSPYNRVVYIADVGRVLWASVRDPDFGPVLNVLAQTVESALRETGAERIDLVGYSAGGRVARAYLGEKPYRGRSYNGQRHVARLITLGTAHATVEVFVAQFGSYLNQTYPGAFYPHIAYRSAVGESVTGQRIGTPEAMAAYRSYELVGNRGDVTGDGVVPVRSCYLAGADNLVLRGIRHIPYFAPRSWYGAPEAVEAWFPE